MRLSRRLFLGSLAYLVFATAAIARPLSPEVAFERAGREFGVPPRLLAAIAYVETRWRQVIPEIEDQTEHGHQRVHGIMGLRDDDWFGHSLRIAASRLGLPVTRLQVDAADNIRGAAAYLASLRSDSGSPREDLSGWLEAVRSYSGIPDDRDAAEYVREVFKTLRDGVTGGRIFIAPASMLELAPGTYDLPSPAESGFGGGEFPGSDWDPSPNITPGAIQPTHIVVHTTQGSFAGAVSWLKNPKSNVSAHYVIRSKDGYIKQLVRENDRAWHARCWNRLAIGIEHEGFIQSPEYYTEAMYRQSAELIRSLATRHGITIDHQHIVGHDFWSKGYFDGSELQSLNCNDHTDPGLYWNWDYFLRLISPPRWLSRS